MASTPKIALLFLTDADPNFVGVWDAWLAGNDDKIQIYIHPKRPAAVKWRRDRVIAALQPTAYGFITRAYRALLAAALADPLNIKFVFLSESCVPAVPFAKMYADLCANPAESLVKRMRISRYDEQARLATVPGLVAAVGRANIIKHYSRSCLCRDHARKVIDDPRVHWFDEMHVGDEFFLSGIQPVRGMKDAAVTEDDWDDTLAILAEIRAAAKALDPKDGEGKAALHRRFDNTASHPRTIHKLTDRDRARIANTQSYFYRKFARGADIAPFLAELGVIQ
jgi:hypothetical protein